MLCNLNLQDFDAIGRGQQREKFGKQIEDGQIIPVPVTNSFLLQHAFAMLFTSLFHLRTTCTFLKADMPLYMY